jgi:hypothetical protein
MYETHLMIRDENFEWKIQGNISSPQIFQKSRSHLKILGARRVM